MSKSIKLSAIVLLNFLLLIIPSLKAEVLLNGDNLKLHIPFVNYQNQNFQVEFTLLDDQKLRLDSAVMRQDRPIYGSEIIVDDEVNFTMSRINFEGWLFDADIKYEGGDLFSYSNIRFVSEERQGRGDLIETDLVTSLGLTEIKLFLASIGLSQDVDPKNDIRLYSVKYQTIDPAGQSTEASALIGLPSGADGSYPIIAYQHPTEVLRKEVPSRNDFDIPTLTLAASGYVAVSADYLGMGVSNFLHPYVHARSLATAVIDALRASRNLAANENIELNGQVFLIGYSEGGYATMAAHREIQRNYADEFKVVASAPLAGPYDISGTMLNRFFDDTPHPSPFYFPYSVLAYNQVFGLTDELSDLFLDPYDQTLPGLFDGFHSMDEINQAIPSDRSELFTESFISGLTPDNTSWAKTVLYENDVYRWKPEVPMYLIHCSEDDQVPYANSQVAFDYFVSVGATQVQLIREDDDFLNEFDVHRNCAIPLLIRGKSFLDDLVQ